MFAALLTVHVLARGITSLESFSVALEAAVFWPVLGVNVLVGLAIVLFVAQEGTGALRVLLTVGAALLIGFVIMLIISQDPLRAYNALLTGPISRLNRWGTWIDDALALLLIATAITVVFRARLFSLGGEGQIFLGALASGLVALYVTGLPPLIHAGLAVAAGCAAGLIWGLIPGLLRAHLEASELVSTLMLNPVAILLYQMFVERLREPGSSSVTSPPLPDTALLARIIPGTRVTTAILIAGVVVLLVWVLLRRTPLGYAIRMIGANPRFAHYGGINVRRTIVSAMLISGALGGLTGAYMALAIYQRLPQSVASGLTFEGIVVALLARNNPLALPAMALLYAYLRAGAPIMQNDAAVSLEIVRVIQAVIILLFTAEGLVSFWRLRGKREAADALQKAEA